MKYFYIKSDIPTSWIHSEINTDLSFVAEQICKKEFGSTCSLQSLVPSTLYCLYRVTYRNKDFVLKINKYSTYFTDYRMNNDILLLPFLKSLEIECPNILTVDLSRKTVPYDYQLLDFVNFPTLFTLSKNNKVTKNAHFQLGVIIKKIHSIPTALYGPLKKSKKITGMFNSWRDYLFCNLDEHISYCIENLLISKSNGEAIEKILSKYEFYFKDIHPVLLHGDIANHNVFVTQKNILLFDWEDSLSGDPIFDIAYFGTGCIENPEWFKHFLEGYSPIISNNFWQKYWVYYLRISLAKAVIRSKFGQESTISRKRIMVGIEETTKRF